MKAIKYKLQQQKQRKLNKIIIEKDERACYNHYTFYIGQRGHICSAQS